MKVLVTGAFGNIGVGTVQELLDQGHQVRCYDIASRMNRKKAARFAGRAEIIWGDLCTPDTLAQAVADMDVVIHLAFVIPKLSATGVGCEDQPDWARQINVGGTRSLLQAIGVRRRPARIIFASSLHIYGITQDQPPPRSVDDPLKPIENYARHKVECEQLVRESGLTWSIFRFAAALPFSLKLDPAMFEIRLDNRMEYVHNRDVGLALANAVSCKEIWGRILHIGGGPRCRYTYRQIVDRVLQGVGVGMLPDSAFSRRPFSTDWIDTEESQRLMRYQRYTLEDYIREYAAALGIRRLFARIFRPILRSVLLSRSPYYRVRRYQRQRESMKGKLAVVTCAATSFGAAAAKKLAREGMRVLLLHQCGEDLRELLFQIREEGGHADLIQADFSKAEENARLLRCIRRNHGPCNVLVNHADLVWYDGKDQAEQNLLGMIRFSELVLAAMKKRGRGHVIFLEPALKLLPLRPTALLRGLRAFFPEYIRHLGRELKSSQLQISLVHAGISTTELLKVSRLLRIFRHRSHGYGIEVRPEAVANRIWMLLIRPERVIYIPRLVRIISWVDGYAGWLVELILRYLSPLRTKSG